MPRVDCHSYLLVDLQKPAWIGQKLFPYDAMYRGDAVVDKFDTVASNEKVRRVCSWPAIDGFISL